MSYAGQGGGFMGSQGGGSQNSPGGGEKKSGSNGLRPVTIAQIIGATQAFADAEFFIDGAEVRDVTLVACIRNIGQTSTQLSLLIEDGTGQIDARLWGQDEEAQNDYELNSYVRIIGTLKTFSNKRHVSANRFRKVTDHNEVLFHAVECIYVHKFYTEGPPGGAKMQEITHQTYDAGENPYAGGATNTSASDTFTDLPPLQRNLMQYILSRVKVEGAGEEGVHVEACVRATGATDKEVKDAIVQLLEDGHLYETIDENHVLPTSV